MPFLMMNDGSYEATSMTSSTRSFKADEEKWFSSPARGLTRRPSAPPAEDVSANIDDSVFDRWASLVPGSR